MEFKRFIFFVFVGLAVFACTKEVHIDIPGYEEQLVVDGRIETDGFPIVLLSETQNIYSPTDLQAYLGSFVNDAAVSVSDGTSNIQLQLFNIADLPLESQKTVAEMISVELNEVVFLPIQVYSTTDISMKGAVGKTYTLNVQRAGKTYSGQTVLLPPVPLDNIYWKPDPVNPQYGVCWAKLSDPVNQYNAYKWEVKRIKLDLNGQPEDVIFRHGSDPTFDDQFFDGLTFEFDTRYPKKDTTYPEGFKRYYKIGDSVVVKFSRLDNPTFEFFDKKDAQLSSNGNPFATPVNIPTNMSGGALGIWAGYSPWYDTLYCIQ